MESARTVYVSAMTELLQTGTLTNLDSTALQRLLPHLEERRLHGMIDRARSDRAALVVAAPPLLRPAHVNILEYHPPIDGRPAAIIRRPMLPATTTTDGAGNPIRYVHGALQYAQANWALRLAGQDWPDHLQLVIVPPGTADGPGGTPLEAGVTLIRPWDTLPADGNQPVLHTWSLALGQLSTEPAVIAEMPAPGVPVRRIHICGVCGTGLGPAAECPACPATFPPSTARGHAGLQLPRTLYRRLAAAGITVGRP
ncbi:hypothetical protein JNJ66_01990 [Candidatus Saccharibacteria bacterium]|nr:hypothetical protein [Candidatus Saccharibacteria bacterium]